MKQKHKRDLVSLGCEKNTNNLRTNGIIMEFKKVICNLRVYWQNACAKSKSNRIQNLPTANHSGTLATTLILFAVDFLPFRKNGFLYRCLGRWFSTTAGWAVWLICCNYVCTVWMNALLHFVFIQPTARLFGCCLLANLVCNSSLCLNGPFAKWKEYFTKSSRKRATNDVNLPSW